MQQSRAGSTLPIAPGSDRVVWAHEMWLEVSEGTDACMVKRIEGPRFLRNNTVHSTRLAKSPKTNKQLPQRHQQTLVSFLHAMYFSTAILKCGLLSLPYNHQLRNWSPCAESLKSAGWKATWGWRMLSDFTLLPHQSARSRAGYVFGDVQKERWGKSWQL